ncbi:MAG: protoporphyrinogen oxidase [Caldilineaceae bacterium]
MNTAADKKRVAVVGAGVAGLTTAWTLQRIAPHVEVTVLEAGTRTGGKVVTHFVDSGHEQPFVLEAGADAFLARQKPWAYQLALDLGLADEILPTDDRHSGVSVVHDGQLLPLPRGLNLILPTDWDAFTQSPLISAAGQARMAQEREIPPRQDDEDESVAEFVTRRLGAEAMEKLAEPLLSGIYSAHPEEQSILATFPRFREMERQHGSLLRALGATPRQRSSPPPTGSTAPTVFISFKNGTETLVRTLAAQVTAPIHLNTAVQTIEQRGDGYRLVLADRNAAGFPYLDADGVVLAVPARVAAQLTSSVSAAATKTLGELRTVSSGVIYLAFRADDVAQMPTGYGVVIPRAEKRNFNAITWVSNKFQRRAPDGFLLVRLFYGGARTPHMMVGDDAAIEQSARAELSALAGISSTPVLSRCFRWWDAQPQYDVHHLRRMEQIKATLPSQIKLIGTPYHGVGIPDCVRQGQIAAETLATQRN